MSGYSTRSRRAPRPARWMDLRYAGTCQVCRSGSPVSGREVTVLSDRRIGGTIEPDPFAKTRSRGYYGRDAGRCEDAPCCGCCS